MSADDWYKRWWLLPGEVAARFGDIEFVFNGDDGTTWAFTLRGVDGAPAVTWNHQVRSVAAWTDPQLAMQFGKSVEDALHVMSGARAGWSIESAEHALLDVVALGQRTSEWVTGKRVRSVLKCDRSSFDVMKERLKPRHLRETTGNQGDCYSLTVPGLLASADGELTGRIITSFLDVLRTAFENDADVSAFTLDDVVSRGGFIDDDRPFIVSVASTVNLFSGASGGGSGADLRMRFGVPRDIESLVPLQTLEDFLGAARRGAGFNRPWPTAPAFVPRLVRREPTRPQEQTPRVPVTPAVRAGKGMPTGTAAASTVDVGIITIREDEFREVLTAFPRPWEGGMEPLIMDRHYNMRVADAGNGQTYSVAIVRLTEQGNGEALNAARDLLHDLKPRLLIVVGIAGGLPDNEFTLGDVIVSTRIIDYSVEQRKEGESPSYSLSGGAIDRALGAAVANLPARDADLGEWTAGLPPRPSTDWIDKLYGPPEWRSTVEASLKHHLASPRAPRYKDGVIASSDRLIKDPAVLFPWIQTARHILAVEMESAGVYRAANSRVPMLAIRGISDLVGLMRDPRWTDFACKSAAAFARAFLRTAPLAPREVHATVSDNSTTTPRPLTPPVPPVFRGEGTALESRITLDFKQDGDLYLSRTTAVFHERMCDAFPGIDSLHRCSSLAESMTRLERLLQYPTVADATSPIWLLGDIGSLSVDSFEILDESTIRIGLDRYVVDHLCGFRSRRTQYEFALLFHGADVPCGVYPDKTRQQMEELRADIGDVTEEYGVDANGILFTRAEHDDAAAYRDGRLLSVRTRLEVRHLTPWVFVLTGQGSPIHQLAFDSEREHWIRDLALGARQAEDFVQRILKLPLRDGDT